MEETRQAAGEGVGREAVHAEPAAAARLLLLLRRLLRFAAMRAAERHVEGRPQRIALEIRRLAPQLLQSVRIRRHELLDGALQLREIGRASCRERV